MKLLNCDYEEMLGRHFTQALLKKYLQSDVLDILMSAYIVTTSELDNVKTAASNSIFLAGMRDEYFAMFPHDVEEDDGEEDDGEE